MAELLHNTARPYDAARCLEWGGPQAALMPAGRSCSDERGFDFARHVCTEFSPSPLVPPSRSARVRPHSRNTNLVVADLLHVTARSWEQLGARTWRVEVSCRFPCAERALGDAV